MTFPKGIYTAVNKAGSFLHISALSNFGASSGLSEGSTVKTTSGSGTSSTSPLVLIGALVAAAAAVWFFFFRSGDTRHKHKW